jgi:hypothetical protein
MKYSRKELDDLGSVALRAIKEIDQEINKKYLTRVFGRLYNKLLKEYKSERI